MSDPASADSPDPQHLIDDVDRELLRLILQRQSLVGKQVRSTERGLIHVADAALRIEAMVNAEDLGADPSARQSLAGVLRHVSSFCLQSLHQLRATYLGPMHSYSHLAAIKYFGDATTLTPVGSIPAVFDSVSRG